MIVPFQRCRQDYLTDKDYRALQNLLLVNPMRSPLSIRGPWHLKNGPAPYTTVIREKGYLLAIPSTRVNYCSILVVTVTGEEDARVIGVGRLTPIERFIQDGSEESY